ncbi:hypothetical protein ACB092_07G096500 [Castanea dentata]
MDEETQPACMVYEIIGLWSGFYPFFFFFFFLGVGPFAFLEFFSMYPFGFKVYVLSWRFELLLPRRLFFFFRQLSAFKETLVTAHPLKYCLHTVHDTVYVFFYY